jgi:hypothetical protein
MSYNKIKPNTQNCSKKQRRRRANGLVQMNGRRLVDNKSQSFYLQRRKCGRLEGEGSETHSSDSGKADADSGGSAIFLRDSRA